MIDVLMTFTGFHDPYFKGLVDHEEQPGPILSLLSTCSFDHIFLFDTPTTRKVTEETKDTISKLYPAGMAHVLEINLSDPTSYQEIFRGLRGHFNRIIEEFTPARFLREAGLTGTDACPEGQLPFYDRQRGGSTRPNVVIIDLSLLASEVLENVTALIGRLIHEFLQRLSDPVSGVGRGEYPVVLILEEAQNYIREGRKTEEDSISKLVFERIAREGRKYGLGLVVASQRPSELSKTVLSQCNSFIVHRLQNPEDLRYFREIVPGIYGQLLDQLPALAPRSALVLGECVQAPALVDIREASPVPKSKNPKFYRSWTQEEKQPDFEAVCERWEGRQPGCPAPADQPHGAPENGGEAE
jgi:hypothetical protein